MNKSIKINMSLYIFLLLSFIILINDYIVYFVNLNYLVGIIISFLITFIICLLLRKKRVIEINNNYSKYDLIFFVLLLFFFIIMVAYPDRTFDTTNYHLYLQEKPFGDKIFGDFFAAKNINTFTYAFTDRFAYIFRYFLGYRLGIIFNHLVYITIFYEVKKIIKRLINTKKELLITIITIIGTITLSSIELIDSYYIDNISVIFLLELFYLTFFEEYSNKLLFYIGLLAGFSFVSKISNAFIVIILAIQYLFLHFKEMKKVKIRYIFLAILLFIFPFFIYMLYTYISTKNPFFPFYNKIFKSNYYSNSNWMDKRFGPKNIIEVLIWPVLMNFFPNRSYDTGIVEMTWGIGYLVCFINIFRIVINKIINNKKIDTIDRIYIFTFIAFIVWSKFMLGYTRYGLSVLYYSIICIIACIYSLYKNNKKILCILLIAVMIINYGFQNYYFLNKANSWTFSNIFSKDYKINNVGYRANLKKILKDRNINIKLKENSVIGIVYENSGQVTMLNDKNDLVSLSSGVSNKYTEKLLEKKLENKTIYSVTDSIDIVNFISALNNKKYKIVNSYGVYEPDFIDSNNKIYMFEIEKSSMNQNSYFEIAKKYKIKTNAPGKYKVSFLSGPGIRMRIIDLSDYSIKLSKCTKEKCTDYIEHVFPKQDIFKYEEIIEIKEDENIYIRLTDKSNEDVNYFAAMIINLKIEQVE